MLKSRNGKWERQAEVVPRGNRIENGIQTRVDNNMGRGRGHPLAAPECLEEHRKYHDFAIHHSSPIISPRALRVTPAVADYQVPRLGSQRAQGISLTFVHPQVSIRSKLLRGASPSC